MNRTLRSLQTIGKSNAVLQKNTQPVQITKRLKRTSTISKKGLNETLQKQNQQSNEALFGLKPVDFTVVPPIRYGAPPPPPKPGMQKYIFPITLIFAGGLVAYFYFNNENDSKEYWEAMQTGGVLPGTYDDEDDDDEYEDDDEE
ncbi:hypothetical protein CTEN210_10168 [Chaetoceros tenuissimus]|uniref:Uncharacterized protein n=1 Tax=Chaetoceros tenuissimus TaxID=426638 RepID=A0AAD3CX70_9STRA|nr:hypothetical protein CTEN210_10168 [Chaetoceros tenuissimus]